MGPYESVLAGRHEPIPHPPLRRPRIEAICHRAKAYSTINVSGESYLNRFTFPKYHENKHKI